MLFNNGGTNNNRNEQLFTLTCNELIDSDNENHGSLSFSDLHIGDDVCDLLRRANFFKPRPLQVKALPLLSKGTDLFVQSEPDTGKSTTISILATQILHSTAFSQTPQVLVVVPSRKIAQQSFDSISSVLPGHFKAGLFVGGSDVKSDVQLLRGGIQVAIGTCGRLWQLVQEKWLKLHNLSLFVLDDADRFSEEDAVRDVNFFISSIPPEIKQICMFGTGYPHHLQSTIRIYMRNPTLLHVEYLNQRTSHPLDYVVFCTRLQKAEVLWDLLTRLSFNQCVIFCDTDDLADDVFDYVNEDDSCVLVTSKMLTATRQHSLRRFADAQVKTLVSTEEPIRGVAFPRTDLVFNIRLHETAVKSQAYGGRFKAECVTITLLGNSTEAELMFRVVLHKKRPIKVLEAEDAEIPKNLVGNRSYFDGCQLFQDHRIITGKMPEDQLPADRNPKSPTNNNEVDLFIHEYSARQMIDMLDSRPQKFFLDLIPGLQWTNLQEIAPYALWSSALASGHDAQQRYVRNYDSVLKPGVYVKTVIDRVRDRNLTDDAINLAEETLMGEFSEYVTTKSERIAALQTHAKRRSLFDNSSLKCKEEVNSTGSMK